MTILDDWDFTGEGGERVRADRLFMLEEIARVRPVDPASWFNFASRALTDVRFTPFTRAVALHLAADEQVDPVVKLALDAHSLGTLLVGLAEPHAVESERIALKKSMASMYLSLAECHLEIGDRHHAAADLLLAHAAAEDHLVDSAYKRHLLDVAGQRAAQIGDQRG